MPSPEPPPPDPDPFSPAARPLLAVGVLLAFVGGYADAGSYLLTKTFTGHATGNAVLLTVNLAMGAWRSAASSALAVAALLVGMALAEWMETGADSPDGPRRLRVPLALEAALIAAAVFCRRWPGVPGNDACIVCMCVALGLQNGALRRCGSLTIHTTFLSGMATKLVSALIKRPPDEKEARLQRHTALTLGGIWIAFIAGALVGAVITYHHRQWGLAGLLPPLAVAWVKASPG